MKTINIAEDTTDTSLSTTKATHTISLTSSSYTNSSGASSVTVNAPSLKAKYNTNAGSRNAIFATVSVRPAISGISANATYGVGNSPKKVNAGVDTALSRSSGSASWSVPLSSLFTSSNSTTKTVSLNWTVGAAGGSGTDAKVYTSHVYTQSGAEWNDAVGWRKAAFSGTISGEGSVTLNAPPTFTSTNVSLSRNPAFTDITNATVTISDLSAKYGGTIKSAVLKIGNQTASRTNNGTLTIALNASGSFTPTVTVTDSRGQVTTKTLAQITVNAYNPPTVNFTVERTSDTGVAGDEEKSAVASVNFKYTSAATTLTAPTVTVEDDNGNHIPVTAGWFATRAADGTLSNPISDWSTVASNSTVYCLLWDGDSDPATGPFGIYTSYSITIRANDATGKSSAAISQTLGSAYYTIDFLAGGRGIAFGQAAVREGFECAMEPRFINSSNTMTKLLDLIYPVGTYLWTSDANFNPANVYGGSWEKLAEGIAIVSAGSNYTVKSGTGKDGGATTVTLSTGNLPAHTHGSKTLTGSFEMRRAGTNGNTDVAAGVSGIVSETVNGGSSLAASLSVQTGSHKRDKISITATHTHDSVGSGTAFSIMQPYKAAYCWHRTA